VHKPLFGERYIYLYVLLENRISVICKIFLPIMLLKIHFIQQKLWKCLKTFIIVCFLAELERQGFQFFTMKVFKPRDAPWACFCWRCKWFKIFLDDFFVDNFPDCCSWTAPGSYVKIFDWAIFSSQNFSNMKFFWIEQHILNYKKFSTRNYFEFEKLNNQAQWYMLSWKYVHLLKIFFAKIFLK